MKNLLILFLLLSIISCTSSVVPTNPESTTMYIRIKSVKNGEVVNTSKITTIKIN